MNCVLFGVFSNVIWVWGSVSTRWNASGTYWEKPVRDVPLHRPLVLGQRNFLLQLSLCPGTRAGVKIWGRTTLSRDVMGQNELKSFEKEKTKFPVLEHHFPISNILFCFRTSFSCFRTFFSCFRTTFSVLDHHFPVLEHPFLFQNVLFLFYNVLFLF